DGPFARVVPPLAGAWQLAALGAEHLAIATGEKVTRQHGSRAAKGAYFILAARSLGLDCGPMSGFNNAQVDEAFFPGTSDKSNFLCNLGCGDASKLYPRSPRLSFDAACQFV